MFLGFEHAAIGSPTPQKLAQWYVDHLGFQINYNSASTVFVKAPDGSLLEILKSDSERSPQSLQEPGLQHLAISVDDFEQAYGTLKAKQVEFLRDPIVRPDLQVVFFRDGEGNYLHLIHREKPLP